MNNTALHIIFGVITFVAGLAFVAAIQLVIWLLPATAKEIVSAEAPPPILRPLESVDAPRSVLELSCYDPDVLPVWQELKKDAQFKAKMRGSRGMLTCSDIVGIKRVDLNGDGSDEVLVSGKNLELCGRAGNCPFWIFENEDGRIRKLLAAEDFLDVSQLGDQVQRSRTRRYSDILLRGPADITESSYITYRFDGRRYVEASCVFQVPKRDRQGEGSWRIISCEEFQRERWF